jgi:hypothetical protein
MSPVEARAGPIAPDVAMPEPGLPMGGTNTVSDLFRFFTHAGYLVHPENQVSAIC